MFTYANDLQHAYAVHLRDAETGLPVAADIDFDSVEALLNFRAPAIPGYRVIHGGQGYLTTREGGQELTLWYAKDAEPIAPSGPSGDEGDGVAPMDAAAAPTAGEDAVPVPVAPEARHAAKTPSRHGRRHGCTRPDGPGRGRGGSGCLGFGVRRRAKHAR